MPVMGVYTPKLVKFSIFGAYTPNPVTIRLKFGVGESTFSRQISLQSGAMCHPSGAKNLKMAPE